MTPQQKLKHMILNRFIGLTLPEITAENIDDIYGKVEEDDEDSMQDLRSEVRGGEMETNIPEPHSRHYEAQSVAAKAPDGSWIGWTYWYGGGKHGEPEAVEWMEDAYGLTCTEEEVMVVQRTFTKV